MTRQSIVSEESEEAQLIATVRRKQFVEGGDLSGPSDHAGRFIDAEGEEFETLPGLVAQNAPWACIAVEVEGGYLAFESGADYEIWHNRNERR